MAYHIDFPFPETAVEWTLTENGVERTERAYRPTFYVAVTGETTLDQLRTGFREHPDVVSIRDERHRPGWRHDEYPMLAVDVTRIKAVETLASTLARIGRPGDVHCFNVDLSRQFRYCLETDTDPTPARELRVCRLSAAPTALVDGIDELTIAIDEELTLDGVATQIADTVTDLVKEHDPDVLQVSTSDLIPALFEAGGPDYQLGREPDYQQLA